MIPFSRIFGKAQEFEKSYQKGHLTGRGLRGQLKDLSFALMLRCHSPDKQLKPFSGNFRWYFPKSKVL